MIEADRRRLRSARRAIARAPLRVLLEHVAYRALLPLTGQLLEDEAVVRRALDLVEAAFWGLADRGVLAFFGIRSAAELGECAVDIRQVDELGGVRVGVSDVVERILHGADRRAGWTSPRDLTIEDLER